MAKVGFWLRGSKGKFANAALQKDANGDTIIREIVTPINPKTPAQTVQRVIVNTVAQAYSAMKAICDHSFEGKSNAGKNMTQFMARNTNAMRANIASQISAGSSLANCYAYTPLGSKQVVPFKYIVSEGSLPEIATASGGTGGLMIASQLAGFGADITYENVIYTLGLQRGDQLTFLFLEKTSYGTKFKYARVILDPQSNGEPAPLSTPFVNNYAINAPNPRNQGALYVNADSASYNVYFGPTNDSELVAGAIIASRKENEKWLRSYAAMCIWDDMLAEYASMQDCLGNVTRAINFASSRYLNNAIPEDSETSELRPGIMMMQTKRSGSQTWETATGNVVDNQHALGVRMIASGVNSDYQMILSDENKAIGQTVTNPEGPSGGFYNQSFDSQGIAQANINWGPLYAYIGKIVQAGQSWTVVAKSPYTFTGTTDEP